MKTADSAKPILIELFGKKGSVWIFQILLEHPTVGYTVEELANTIKDISNGEVKLTEKEVKDVLEEFWDLGVVIRYLNRYWINLESEIVISLLNFIRNINSVLLNREGELPYPEVSVTLEGG